MKRPVLVAAVLALAVVMTATAGSASSARVKIGAERACKTGQFRCFAMIQTRDGKRVTAATPFALPAGYGPAAYHKAYSLPTTATGNRTVTIVDAYDDKTIAADLAKYSTAFGIPQLPSCTSTVTTSCFKKINLGAPVNSAVTTGWDIEIALDVETVHAICQNCKIVLVEAVNSNFSSLEAAVDRAHTEGGIISNSYGSYGFDGSSPGDDTHYNHPKDAIVVSAGDDGYGAAYPAVLNTVVAVGGTKLTLNSTGGYGSERAWGPDATHAWGSGSGCANGRVSGASPIAAQTFQRNVANYTNTGCGTTRGMNDVSANADPNTGSAVFANSMGWGVIGGTSLSAPLISAVFALKGDYTTVNYPAQLLYSHFGTTSFRDVKTGTDDAGNYPIACSKVPACNAVKGYDLPTGVGTPKGTSGF